MKYDLFSNTLFGVTASLFLASFYCSFPASSVLSTLSIFMSVFLLPDPFLRLCPWGIQFLYAIASRPIWGRRIASPDQALHSSLYRFLVECWEARSVSPAAAFQSLPPSSLQGLSCRRAERPRDFRVGDFVCVIETEAEIICQRRNF